MVRRIEEVSLSHIHSLMEYAPGILYIGSDDGMTRYEMATGRTQHFLPVELDDRSINNQFVYPILRDKEGGLWVGTYYGGINYASPRSGVFTSYSPSAYRNSLHGQVISRFCEDREGRIWIGSDDGGLSCLDPRRDQPFTHFEKEGTSPRNVHALCTLGDELWIGTYTQGIDVMNLRTGAVRHYRELLDIYDNSAVICFSSIVKTTYGQALSRESVDTTPRRTASSASRTLAAHPSAVARTSKATSGSAPKAMASGE